MEKGYFYNETRIKANAKPIDNIEKFAWADEDYETVKTWHEYTTEELADLEVLRNKPTVEGLNDIIAEQDNAICELYEANLSQQAEMDEAICSLYEMIVGGI